MHKNTVKNLHCEKLSAVSASYDDVFFFGDTDADVVVCIRWLGVVDGVTVNVTSADVNLADVVPTDVGFKTSCLTSALTSRTHPATKQR